MKKVKLIGYNFISLYIIFYGLIAGIFVVPAVKGMLIITFVTLIITVVMTLTGKLRSYSRIEEKKKYFEIGVVLSLPFFMVFISGPIEFYLENMILLTFDYSMFLGYLIGYFIVVVIAFTVATTHWCNDIEKRVVSDLIVAISLVSYIQKLFLNNHVNVINGIKQDWSISIKISNLLIWILGIVIIFVIDRKLKKGPIVIRNIAGYFLAFQAVVVVLSFVSVIQKQPTDEKLLEDGLYELAPKDNTVVFILDTYDSKMVDYIEKYEPDFFEPLQDFTLYKNVDSLYHFTDDSMAYLLTGEFKGDVSKEEACERGVFLTSVKKYVDDLRIGTDTEYVRRINHEGVDNYKNGATYKAKPFGMIRTLSKCVRFVNSPYIIKSYYNYIEADIQCDTVADNIYRTIRDDMVYNHIKNGEVKICNEWSSSFRMYHLYGAHFPYYLTRNKELDYSKEDPLAQLLGSMEIVYEYIESMKELGVYDSANIIITADHGLNPSTAYRLDELGVHIDDETCNPLFFIKRAGEKNDSYKEIDTNISQEAFNATVIKLLDPNNDNYGKAIWEY